MKLIKLEDKFILVNDKQIQINDNYVAWETNYATEPKERWVMYNRVSGLNGTNQYKIISEKPDFSLLSEANCKEIGWVNELILAEINSEKHYYAFGQQSEFYQLGFIEGFKTAQSLNDKMFSLKDKDFNRYIGQKLNKIYQNKYGERPGSCRISCKTLDFEHYLTWKFQDDINKKQNHFIE